MLRLCTHWNLSLSSAVISCLFLCIPDNSMTLCPFRQLPLHSDSETTDNIQPYCPGTLASGMYSILGWWQLFGYLCGMNALIVEIVPSSHSSGTLQSVLAWHTVGRKSWQGPLQRPSQSQKLSQKAHRSRSSLLLNWWKLHSDGIWSSCDPIDLCQLTLHWWAEISRHAV